VPGTSGAKPNLATDRCSQPNAPHPLQQPLGEVGTRPQLRDRQLDRPGTGVPVSLPARVPPVDPLIAALAVTGPADAIGL
jgi:hypothetical protein